MKIFLTLTDKHEFSECYQSCPFFDTWGGPGPIMVCNHPGVEDGRGIISHPECEGGFPPKCPLLGGTIDFGATGTFNELHLTVDKTEYVKYNSDTENDPGVEK